MPVIMGGSPGKDFMNMNKALLAIVLGMASVTFTGCDNNEVVDELPPAVFNDIFIDLSLPQYQDLSRNGGFEYLSAGLRGIIVYRENASTYHAIEQNCTFLPFEAGSTVDVDNGIRLRDPSCGSVFTLPGGLPIGGPAVVPLRKYRVDFDGTRLIISDEVIN